MTVFLEGVTTVLNVGMNMTLQKSIPATTPVIATDSYTLIKKKTGNNVAFVTVISQTKNV